ncbi:hypothetical protein [Variovorax sp. PCZ-1]|uniref:hypothetical protein n=1 Tax=Variovorax sp. PCZ-1 TaxID=2835533 RepID=UPI001BCCC467|nr:hypothetical protein [Variovorax sp. PCZ-1]MBS7807502.1 hypothetical protein [Variovorax sp. PCZ-1]
MRAVFGILSLLIVLLIVGSLVKKQMATTTAPVSTLQVPSATSTAPPASTQRDQAQQIQQQIKQTIDSQMQAPRDRPADSK